MYARKLSLAAVILASTALSACGSSSNGGTTTTPPVTVTPKQEDQFGAMFGVDYRASANTEPAPAVDGDIVPVSLTTEPAVVN